MTARKQAPAIHRVGMLALCAALAGCPGPADEPQGPTPEGPTRSVAVSVVPTAVVVFQSGTAKATVNITRTNYTGALTLSDSGLPSGVTATFDPPVLSGGTLSSAVTFTGAVNATAGTGPGPIYIKVRGADGFSATGSTTLTVARPQITVARTGTGTGTVTSSPAGINCGGACTASFAPGTSATLTAAPAAGSVFAGWSGGGGACSGTSTCALAVTSAYNVTATFNSTAQSFALAANPSTGNVPQGGTATATVNITRVNGYAGGVSITTTGAPTGVTIVANPASATGSTATLNISAASTVPAGNYPITISGSGAGITGAQTATLNLQVTPAPGGSGNVTFSFARCDAREVPVWAAAQSGTGAWTRVTAGPNNTFTFAAGATGGIAVVHPFGAGFHTEVIYASRDELTSLALGSPCGGLNASRGTKRLTGTLAGADLMAPSIIDIGGASTARAAAQGQAYTLDSVPAGRRDLIAARITANASGFPFIQRLVLRRNVDYAATIPALDLFGAESVPAVIQGIAMLNVGADQSSMAMSFITANGASAPYFTRPAGPNGGMIFAGLPDSLLQPGDLHAIQVTTAPTAGSSFRLAIVLHHSIVADTVTFGPTLNQPTVTALGASPYLRLHAQLASQSAYSALVNADFSQGANTVSVVVTAGYVGSTPPTWSIDIPDLTSAGYDPAWGLGSGSSVRWEVFAGGGSVLPLLGATPVDGARILGAGVSNSSAAFSQLGRLRP